MRMYPIVNGENSMLAFNYLWYSLFLPPVLPSPLNSHTPNIYKALESIISLVYTRFMCSVHICATGEERAGGKHMRSVEKQSGGSKMKVFHRN